MCIQVVWVQGDYNKASTCLGWLNLHFKNFYTWPLTHLQLSEGIKLLSESLLFYFSVVI